MTRDETAADPDHRLYSSVRLGDLQDRLAGECRELLEDLRVYLRQQ